MIASGSSQKSLRWEGGTKDNFDCFFIGDACCLVTHHVSVSEHLIRYGADRHYRDFQTHLQVIVPVVLYLSLKNLKFVKGSILIRCCLLGQRDKES